MAWLQTLGRIPKILESNVNALLDKAQDPVKMSKQYIINYKQQLADVRDALGELMADLDQAKANLDKAQKRVDKLTVASMNAVKANDREGATLCVQEKQKAEVARNDYKQVYDNLLQQCNQMKAGYNKLVADLDVLQAAADRTATKTNMAKAIEKSNKALNNFNVGGISDSFAQMEEAADRKLAKANAMRTLDSNVSDADAIINKYATGAGPAVEDEVNQLFAAMNAVDTGDDDDDDDTPVKGSYHIEGTVTSI